MRSNYLKTTLKTAVLAVTILLFGVGMALGQATVYLTAGPSNVPLPDGNIVPMWGYSCGTGATVAVGASCSALNAAAGTAGTWSPVIITVPYSSTGTSLTINLSNNLTFPIISGGSNTVPTSLVIVGQLGGGLGTPGSFTAPPDHTLSQQVTWPIASAGQANQAPTQGPRVQSFATEVAVGTTGALSWSNLKPGTYLI